MLAKEKEAMQAYRNVIEKQTNPQQRYPSMTSELETIYRNHEKSAGEIETVIRRNIGVSPTTIAQQRSFHPAGGSFAEAVITNLKAGEELILQTYNRTVLNGSLIPDIRNFITTNIIPRVEINIQILGMAELKTLIADFCEITRVDDYKWRRR